jgi:hypothetical protein
MATLKELKDAVKKDHALFWNDPDPILTADYRITYIEPLDEIEDPNNPILVHYGDGSEAQVFAHEILIQKRNL